MALNAEQLEDLKKQVEAAEKDLAEEAELLERAKKVGIKVPEEKKPEEKKEEKVEFKKVEKKEDEEKIEKTSLTKKDLEEATNQMAEKITTAINDLNSQDEKEEDKDITIYG